MHNEKLTTFIIDKIYENISSRKVKFNDRLNFRCPYCGDSKKNKTLMRGWFYFKNNSYYCFNCSKTALAYDFLAFICNKDVTQIKKELITSKVLDIKSIVTKHVDKEPVKEVNSNFLKPIDILPSWIPYNEHDISNKIVTSRKLMEAPFKPKNWNLFYCKDHSRLVLPWYHKDKMVYYQMRRLYKIQNPKYLFPYNTSKNVFVVNFDDNYEYLFLLEGLFDAIFCKNSACVGGVNMTDLQESILKPYRNQGVKIVWLLDNQYQDKTSFDKSIKLLEQGESVFVWDKKIKEKDINEFFLKTKSKIFEDINYLKSRVMTGYTGIVTLKLNK